MLVAVSRQYRFVFSAAVYKHDQYTDRFNRVIYAYRLLVTTYYQINNRNATPENRYANRSIKEEWSREFVDLCQSESACAIIVG